MAISSTAESQHDVPPDRPVSPINEQDLVELDALPMFSRGWDDLTSSGLDAESREKVMQIYRESRHAAQRGLIVRKSHLRLQHVINDLQDKISRRRDEYEDEDEDDFDDDEYEGTNMYSSQIRRARYAEMLEWEQEVAQKRDVGYCLKDEFLNHDESLKSRAKECAVLLCPPFTARVRAAFPAELRSHIYDYLWDEKEIDSVDADISSSPISKSDYRFWAPFFADAHIVDPQFALEAATHFFRSVSTAEVHYRLVRAFCEMSTFGNMAIRPINIIRRLSIDVAWDIERWRNFAYPKFRQSMEYLLTLPVKDDFEIVIYLPRCMQFSRLLFHVLETLRPIYKESVEKGMEIKILGHEFFPDDEAEVETAEQLNHYFDGTPEMWFAMKNSEIALIQQRKRKSISFGILEWMRHNFEDRGELEMVEDSINIKA